ncbi:MAG: acetate--CoA ligase family protein, partial [Solirubrobacteraceae bacterium]
ACQAFGVEVPELPAGVRAKLAAFLPDSASLGNPIDMIATASAEDFGRTLRTLAESGACDAILTIFVPPLVTQAADVGRAIRAAAASCPEVTMAAVFMTSEGAPEELSSDELRVPAYAFPEDAARAIAHAARHGRWRTRSRGLVRTPEDARPTEAAAIISEALSAGGGWLSPERVCALFECYGLPLLETRVVPDADQAARAAEELGVPVALKAVGPKLLHKTDAGGVRLNVDGAEAVRRAAAEITEAVARAGHELEGLIVQPMSPQGVELIVGVVHDQSFGPVIVCGAGGTTAELIKDVAVRITPLTDLDAREMLRSLRTFPLLDGYRGAPRADQDAVEDVLMRVSAMVDAHPEIAELDCNPLIVLSDGALIVDARVRVEAAAPPAPVPSLGA